MSMGDAVFLSGVIGAFLIFGATLAWVSWDYQKKR